MLPLSPPDQQGLDQQDELRLAQDLAEDFSDYVSEELTEILFDMAASLIERRTGIDPQSSEGYDLALDLMRRISITAIK